MKILWFSNSPCNARKKLTGITGTSGGWLQAMSSQLAATPGIKLHIAFYWGIALKAFEYEGIVYHPILREGENSTFGRYIHRLITQFSNKTDQKEVKRLLAIVKEVDPDIIHIQGSEENFGLIAPLLPKRKIVLSVQGLLSPILDKRYAGIPFSEALCHDNKLKCLLIDGAAAERRRNRRAAKREQEFMPFIKNVIGRTNWDYNASLALNPHRHYFSCNEILREDFYKAQWQPLLDTDTFTLCTTISNGLYKGLETIYHTAEILQKWGISFQWKIIGINSQDHYVKLTEKYTRLKAPALNIVYLGRKNAKEVVNILLGTNIYVQCSHIENSPNSICEAMLLGMPIIASNVGGTSSLLKDKDEGLLVQDGEPYALAGMIMEQKRNPEKGIIMGQAAREKALRRHHPKEACSQILSIYQNI